MGIILLGIDPGLASMGVAVIETTAARPRIVALDVLRTAKSPRKAGVLQSEDTTERLRALAEALGAICAAHRPSAFCMESFSPPRSASVAAKCGMAVGLVVGLAVELGVPVFQASPQTIRRRLGLPKGASKAEVWDAVENRIGGRPDGARWSSAWNGKQPAAGQQEHAFDALAAAVVCAPEVVG